MRVHIQNPPDDPVFPITRVQWDDAVSRSPDMADVDLTMSGDTDGFARGMATAEVLLTWTKQVTERLPRGALPGL
ncbi:MAG: D-2-hydroxyacid dehydrogenase, partial [Gemmatimonadaceae bacterium]|nr:D-2-hydroxyacid dehydrogenase [Acetobacteraceae bacterium]